MRCNGTGSNQSLGLKMASGIAALLMVLPLQSSMAQEPRDRYREPVDYGPYRVEMKRVIEGYRFDLRWREGPGSRRNGRFRLSNVNTPGIHVKRDCERDRGKEAKEFVERFTKGRTLEARDVRKGRDSQVWVGRLEADGEDLSQALLDAGLAVPYNDSSRNPETRRWVCEGENSDPLDLFRE